MDNRDSRLEGGEGASGDRRGAASPSLDTTYLERLRDLGGAAQVDIAANIIHIFMKNAPLLLASLAEAIAACPQEAPARHEQATRAAHKFKSSSANVGAIRLSSLLDEMQLLEKGAPDAQWRRVLEEVRLEYSAVTEALAAFLKRAPS